MEVAATVTGLETNRSWYSIIASSSRMHCLKYAKLNGCSFDYVLMPLYNKLDTCMRRFVDVIIFLTIKIYRIFC